jgi:subtilisin family serine protease
VRSLDWAVAHRARIINMSFAGPRDPEIAASLAVALKKGVVLIASAGNAGRNAAPLYPAADPNVIAVTAIDAEDHLLGVANRGRHIAVAAPGVDIVGPASGGGYQMSTGTSVAAAHVSGVAALLIAFKPTLTPDAVRKLLASTATDLGPKGRDDQFGAGLVDAYRALLSVNPANAARPKANNSVDVFVAH